MAACATKYYCVPEAVPCLFLFDYDDDSSQVVFVRTVCRVCLVKTVRCRCAETRNNYWAFRS